MEQMNALPYYGQNKKKAGAELCQALVKVWYFKTLVDQCNHFKLLQKFLLLTWIKNKLSWECHTRRYKLR